MQAALRDGDLAKYGQLQKELGSVLDDLARAAATAPTPSPSPG